ncbi:MAG: V-type ATP synthase subunit I [Firmicutes bacterium]|nr:V-type ATP synthase subunit I [Bacillota bacterium]
MAMLEMRRISLCAMKKNRKQILELLQRRGMIEVQEMIPEDSIFETIDLSSSCIVFEKTAREAVQALEILGKYIPDKKAMLASFYGRQEISVEFYNNRVDERDKLIHLSHRINSLAKEIAENQAALLKLKAQLEALVPWMNLDIPMSFKGTKSTSAFIGTLPRGMDDQEILEQLAQAAPDTGPVNLDRISYSPEQTCLFLLGFKRDEATLENALRSMGFARPVSQTLVAPALLKKEIEKSILDTNQAIADATAEVVSYGSERTRLWFMVDYYHIRAQKYQVIGKLIHSQRTFILSGFIPESTIQLLEQELSEKFNIAIEWDTPLMDEDVPVLLQNSGFSTPVEGVVESYSLPGKGEIDPTNGVARFYYLLFGMMLGDAAYGLIMVLVCGTLLLKFKNMESGLKKYLKMFLYCGVATIFWGIMFGSYFGDVVDVISTTYFGTLVTIPPVWFIPLYEPMRMLAFALAVGIVHIYAGLGMKAIQLIKLKKYKDVFYDVIFWYILNTSLILLLLSMNQFTEILGLNFALPALVGSIASVFALVSAIAIVGTAGRESRNPFKRFLKGLYHLYGVTGYLGDVLSYSRLLALGLATSVIASVVNKMAAMAGPGIMGIIAFMLIFILGHTINIGINALGAYVHTNRLQFVEFFGKFYEGGGRKFTPFAVDTKYFKFKEEKNRG